MKSLTSVDWTSRMGAGGVGRLTKTCWMGAGVGVMVELTKNGLGWPDAKAPNINGVCVVVEVTGLKLTGITGLVMETGITKGLSVVTTTGTGLCVVDVNRWKSTN